MPDSSIALNKSVLFDAFPHESIIHSGALTLFLLEDGLLYELRDVLIEAYVPDDGGFGGEGGAKDGFRHLMLATLWSIVEYTHPFSFRILNKEGHHI